MQSHHYLQKQAAIGMALLLAVLCVMCFALAVHAAQCPCPCVCLCIIKRRQRHAWPAPANDCMPFLFIKTRDAHLTHSACDECPSFVCSLGAWVDCHTLSHRRQAPSGTTCARARALSLCRNRVTFELYLTTTHTAIHGCISALF